MSSVRCGQIPLAFYCRIWRLLQEGEEGWKEDCVRGEVVYCVSGGVDDAERG